MKMGISAKKSRKRQKTDSDLDEYNDMSYKEVNDDYDDDDGEEEWEEEEGLDEEEDRMVEQSELKDDEMGQLEKEYGVLHHREIVPTTTTKLGKEKKPTGICDERARDKVVQCIANFFFECSIPFNVLHDKSFKLMIQAIGSYGPNLKLPSLYEMRVPLLKKQLKLTEEMMLPHIEERAKSGCSIMFDAWTNRENRTLINLMVNSARGTMFIKSVDASEYVNNEKKIFELLDTFVTDVGEENVVQVITHGGSNYALAGKKLMARRQRLFWTPCAAHCIDLMLEEITKLPKIERACRRGIGVVGFIYNHTMALNTMRKFTNKVELVRAGITRFATHFLILQMLHKQKNNLQRMFTSDEWLGLSVAKETEGKNVRDIVLMPFFWNDVLYTLKAMGPLVQVLRLVINEKKPAMGHIYEAMDRAKETMRKSFNNNEDKYTDIFEIIDKNWQCQLYHPLHAAGHYLNPQYYYAHPEIDGNAEIIEGLLKCIERLSVDEQDEDKAINELACYRRFEGTFSMKAAIRNRTALPPVEWWWAYGHHVPSLQRVAIKVLSLICSSSGGCERNWSTFEQIHAKKINKLEHQRMQDLAYIKYNHTLKERFDSRDLTDPIVLKDIDLCSEWLTGEMVEGGEVAKEELIFEKDLSTWGDVADAARVGESATVTRQQQRSAQAASALSTATQNMEEDEEDEDIELIEYEDDNDEELFF